MKKMRPKYFLLYFKQKIYFKMFIYYGKVLVIVYYDVSYFNTGLVRVISM